MDLDPFSLFVTILVSSLGLGIFIYGKRQTRAPQLVAGFLLMACPYLLPGAGWTIAVGTALLAALWGAVRLGV